MKGNGRFEKLVEPYHIGKVQTKNRMVKTAAGTNFWEMGERRISGMGKAFYEAVARGGAGLVMVESPIMEDPFDEPGDQRYRIDDDKYIKEVSELAEVVHRHNCPLFMQTYHRGPWEQPYAKRRPRIAASPVKSPTIMSEFDLHGDEAPREMTVAEIEEIAEIFVNTAVRAHKAGFDGFEINSASDSLFSTFISRFWNKRTDEYGADNVENRTRFLRLVVGEIKKRISQDFPVMVIINAVEVGGGEDGITFEESRAFAKRLEEAGVDAFHVRSHWFGNHVGSYNHDNLFFPEPQIPLKDFPKELNWSMKWRGVNIPCAENIKSVVSVPVMTVGGFNPELAEKVLREGKADLIGFCRPIFADPDFPRKVIEGRLEDIAPCTRCSECQKMDNKPRRCRIDAALGTEQYIIEEADTRKKVVVIGSGPAGMSAARVAAVRGHEVTLYDKANKPGGLLPMAIMVKGTEIEDLPAFIRYFTTQLKKLGVTMKLGQEFTAATVDEIKPDVVILAAGGIPSMPDIPGIHGRNVVSNADLHRMLKRFLRFFSPSLLRWLTKFWMPIGKRVVVMGGALPGCEVAELLVKRGRQVTIVDTVDELGEGLVIERKNRMFWWFKQKNVPMIAGATYEEITDKGLVITTKDGQKLTLEADTIVPTQPVLENTGLLRELEGKVAKVYAIGDCKDPRLIPDAVAAGWKIGNSI
jgi:2,4-dienoyl-CoA reductase (NADPH2)